MQWRIEASKWCIPVLFINSYQRNFIGKSSKLRQNSNKSRIFRVGPDRRAQSIGRATLLVFWKVSFFFNVRKGLVRRSFLSEKFLLQLSGINWLLNSLTGKSKCSKFFDICHSEISSIRFFHHALDACVFLKTSVSFMPPSIWRMRFSYWYLENFFTSEKKRKSISKKHLIEQLKIKIKSLRQVFVKFNQKNASYCLLERSTFFGKDQFLKLKSAQSYAKKPLSPIVICSRLLRLLSINKIIYRITYFW